MKVVLTFLLTFIIEGLLAGTPSADKILQEGRLLYRLEKASWYATDHFLANYKLKQDSIGGYLSYVAEDKIISTIFYSRYNTDDILLIYRFDSIPEPSPAFTESQKRIASDHEKQLIAMRKDALSRISINPNNFFSFYQECSFNVIPLIADRERKVYILSGPKVSDLVMIGNDYLLTYNEASQLVDQQKIHSSLIQTPYSSGDPKNKITTTYHTHVKSEVIDPTDICTLLLYKDYVEWKQHYVVSKNYVSIFDLEKESLVILTKQAWENISGSPRKKKEKK